MRIKSNDIIAGKPVLAIRKLLRYRDGSIDTIMDVLSTDEEEARKIYLELCKEGYIQPSSDTFDKDIEQWHNTLKGNALANAHAKKPITRQTAERLVAELLNHAREVNSNDDYAYRIKQIVIFGSYLSESPDLGDIDISVLLEPRHSNTKEQEEHWQKRIDIAVENGRHFRNIVDEVAWPQTEILRFLKGRSSFISLHVENLDQLTSNGIAAQILFEVNSDKI